jgi:signal transduction histidine kinase
MSFLVRLSLILGIALFAIGGAMWTIHRGSEAHLRALVQERRDERARFYERAVQLQGTGLETLVSSYSWWKEMVAFVENPDPKWPSDSVDNIVGAPNSGDALWIFNEQFQLVHHIDADFGRPSLPFDDVEHLQRHIGDRYQFSFFRVIDGQLWQIFGAAVQDPKFWRHETPVRGYLLLGKRWDETWLARLGDLTQSRLQVLLTPAPVDPPARGFSRPIVGLGGVRIGTMLGLVDPSEVEGLREGLQQQLFLVFGGLMVLAAIMLAVIAFFVIQPINAIVRSLESRTPIALARLLEDRTPFGEIARLLSSQFRQGRMLQDEIRRHLGTTTPQLLAREAESNENLRLRLASDLHDGPLQSIYAAGLKLGVLEKRLQSKLPVSSAEVESIRLILKECTVNLRNLLFDLEPEELQNQDLEAALDRLERYMKSVAGRFEISIEENAFDGLGREPQLHLFYICRELASNAARHARPTYASLSFQRKEGFLTLTWENDGVLVPNTSPKSGNGLRNIDQRVKRLDGSWRHRLQREQVWSVSIDLPYTSLITPLPLGAPTIGA